MRKGWRRYGWTGAVVLLMLMGGLGAVHDLFGSVFSINAVWPKSGLGQNLGDNPIDVVTSPFGVRLDSSGHYDFHEGIDIRANPGVGLDVHAMFDGHVLFAVPNLNKAGNVVMLRHMDPVDADTFYTYYIHLTGDELFDDLRNGTVTDVSTGEYFVNAGNTAGVGQTVPYHLHFAGLTGGTNVRKNTINPMRKDSLPFFNFLSPCIDIKDMSTTHFVIEVKTGGTELDFNRLEVEQNFGLDQLVIDIDKRLGVDNRFRNTVFGQNTNTENTDEDGIMIEKTLFGETIYYRIEPQSFSSSDDPTSSQVIDFVFTQFPSDWIPPYNDKLKITAFTNTDLPNINGPVLQPFVPLNENAAPLHIATPTSAGVVWFDFDNDGDEDLFAVRDGGNHYLYRNDGASFTNVSSQKGFTGGINGAGRMAVAGDYDNDGDLDLFVSSTVQSVLYRNDAGAFTNVSSLLPGLPASEVDGAAWADYDNDGDLDLYIVYKSSPNRLYRNNGGTFTEVASSLGVAGTSAAQEGGLAWGDYDNDGDLDLYVASLGPSFLFRNNGGSSFTNVAAAAGVEENVGGYTKYGAAWGDYDNDGYLDLAVVNGSTEQSNKLYHNNGDGTFTEVSEATLFNQGQAGRGVSWVDFDLDGDLDIYISNYGAPNALYRNDMGRMFVDVAALLNVNNTMNDSGMSWGDQNGDGAPDLYVATGGSANIYCENIFEGGFNWLDVKLQGLPGSRDAGGIGARVRVVANGKSQIREVDGGSGYLSQPSLPVEFGLGEAAVVDSVIVSWPGRPSPQVLTGVAVNQRLVVQESLSPPNPPSNLSAVPLSSTQIRLNWSDLSSDETGFKIERKKSTESTYTQIATVGTNVTTYTNGGLQSGTTYNYRIRAYNQVGDSPYSNVATATTQSVPPITSVTITGPDPATPNIKNFYTVNITGGSGNFDIQWYKRDSASGSNYFWYDGYTTTTDVTPGPTTFALRVDVTDNASSQFVQAWKGVGGASTPTKPVVNLPSIYALEGNYPNPFNPSTTIRFALPQASHVRLEIYNVAGQRVRLLLDESRPAGRHAVVWDGRSDSGSAVASGLYLYRITAGAFVARKKMTLLK